jgi:hypothetical protein
MSLATWTESRREVRFNMPKEAVEKLLATPSTAP